MKSYKSQIAVIIAVFVFGWLLGKTGTTKTTDYRSTVFPVEGLQFNNVTLTTKSGTSDTKIMTISHTTPSGVVRYGRGVDPDNTRSHLRMDGTFCGEKITIFGEVLDRE